MQQDVMKILIFEKQHLIASTCSRASEQRTVKPSAAAFCSKCQTRTTLMVESFHQTGKYERTSSTKLYITINSVDVYFQRAECHTLTNVVTSRSVKALTRHFELNTLYRYSHSLCDNQLGWASFNLNCFVLSVSSLYEGSVEHMAGLSLFTSFNHHTRGLESCHDVM